MAGQATRNPRPATAGGSPAGAPMARQLDQTLADLDRVVAGLAGEPVEDAGLAAQGTPLAGSEPAGEAEGTGNTALVLVQEPAPPELDSETLALLTRFVAGALTIGGDMLFERLRYWDEQAAIEAGPGTLDAPLEEATSADLVRYWLLGTITWGRRQAVGAVHRSLGASAGLAGSAARTADRLTSNWLLRPLRQPLADAISTMARSANDRIREGQQEDRISRWMATQTIEDIVDQTIDYISENPQLAALVRDQLAAQSVGLTTAVVDTSRDWGEAADDVVEATIRRLLGRGRRKAAALSASVTQQRVPPDDKVAEVNGDVTK